MPTLIIRLIGDLRASYWLWPGVMTLCACLLAYGTIWLDERWGSDWIESLDIFRSTHADSARAVLSLVAQAMIGVAGVTFSITLVAVSFASSQFGPRLVGNFMRDTGNQLVLGAFIATFTYAMLVLRAVEAVGETDQGERLLFVPHISVLTAITLALICVGALVYFIHHVPNSIDIGAITARVGRALKAEVSTPFPQTGLAMPASTPTPDMANGLTFEAGATGYVQSVNADGLIEAAQKGDLVIRLLYRPGDFVVAGDPLFLAVRATGGAPAAFDDDDTLHRCFAIGPEKTATQNMLFLADELVEIAGLALSPGVNDPYTAMTCLDWMEASLRQAARETKVAPCRGDENGALRLVVDGTGFTRLLERMLARVTPYAASDFMTAIHLVRKLAQLALHVPAEHREAVIGHLDAVARTGEVRLTEGPVRDRFREAAVEARETALAPPEDRMRLRLGQSWLGGSG